MPRKKKKRGRPLKFIIDGEQVRQMAMIGCTTEVIAVLPGHFSQQIGRPSTFKAMPTTIWQRSGR